MADGPDIRQKIYAAYAEHSKGSNDWHPTTSGPIRDNISGAILEVLSGDLSDEDLKGLSRLLAGFITDEKRAEANFWTPTFNAD